MVEAATKTYRILVVEDHRVNQTILVEMLRMWGIVDVYTASNGADALTAMQEQAFDLVLMDCELPVMNGYEATRAWREIELRSKTRHLPVVAVTANAMLGARDECIRAGMDEYLSKPLMFDQLCNVLGRLLNQNIKIDFSQPQINSVSESMITLDMDVIASLKPVMGDKFGKLIRLFSQGAEHKITELRTLIPLRQSQLIEQLAHGLKGSAYNIGAQRLGETAALLEQAAANGKIDHYEPLFQLLQQEYKKAYSALKLL